MKSFTLILALCFYALLPIKAQSLKVKHQQVKHLPKLSSKKPKKDDGQLVLTLLQINDVYEIAPLQGGKLGGMARVAQLRADLKAQNPNTYFVHAGDFVNPSVIGTLKHEGKSIKGRQMVECMNAAGVDLVTFGNHEFDLKEEELLSRIEESDFTWVAGNARHRPAGGAAQPFRHRNKDIPQYHIQTFRDADGTSLRIGFIAVSIGSNAPKYVQFEEPLAKAQALYQQIKDSVDFVVALTHLDVADDLKLAQLLPELPLILGGHDHYNMYHRQAKAAITKADANAITAYVHQLHFDRKKRVLSIKTQLKSLDSLVGQEPKTKVLVDKWMEIAYRSFRAQGFEPTEQVMVLKNPLDARESVVRHKPTQIGDWCAQSIAAASPKAQGALLNTGSIRIDDVLVGEVTQFDIIRILPFGGNIVEVEMKGSLLLQILKIGLVDNVGKGGYFAVHQLEYNANTQQGKVAGQNIQPQQTYRIAMPAFLLTGQESGLDFFLRSHPQIVQVHENNPQYPLQEDLRKALMEYMKNKIK
jgi:5'-nucleotidase